MGMTGWNTLKFLLYAGDITNIQLARVLNVRAGKLWEWQAVKAIPKDKALMIEQLFKLQPGDLEKDIRIESNRVYFDKWAEKNYWELRELHESLKNNFVVKVGE